VTTAIKAGWLWDGTGAPPVRDGVVIFDGDHIADVGPANAVTLPPDAQVIDCPDEFVMPG
jgi:imidazolonepropionase-like amidohydrolase